MDSFEHELEHPKKRRRREIERRPLTTRLVFDDTVKADAAVIPQALWTKLTDGPDGMSSLMICAEHMLKLILQVASLQPLPHT